MFDPSLFEFLQELAENNNRVWFEVHKPAYKSLKEVFTREVFGLASQIADFDGVIRNEIDHPKTVKIFRIYRDARFSKDKTPYKINFGAAIAACQRETEPAYYLHIEPGNCFAGGGLYMPPNNLLQTIREAIDEQPKTFNKVLSEPSFKLAFPDGLIQDGALKTAPRGYAKDHPAIELLRLKSFAAIRHFSDEAVLNDDFEQELMTTYEALAKLNDLLRELAT